MSAAAAILGLLFIKPALVLAGALLIVTGCRRQPAAARHSVWVGALIATILLPILGLVLPPLRVGTLAPMAVAIPVLPAAHRLVPEWSDNGPSVPSESSVGQNGPRDAASTIVLALWAVGALVVLTRRVNAQIRLRGVIRRSVPPSDRVTSVFDRVVSPAGAPRRVALRMSDEITSPAVAGMRRAVVLLPPSAHQWAEEDLRDAFLHELSHVRRLDGWWNLLGDAAKVLYWCNPLVRYAVQRLRSESERACDDQVLIAGAEPEAYAHLLVQLAAAEGRGLAVSHAGMAMSRLAELENRLLAVLDPRLRRGAVQRRANALGGLALVLALPMAALTPVPRSEVPNGPEPDRRGDSLANPLSERLPGAARGYAVPEAARGAGQGPDSTLVRTLVGALEHVPSDPADLVRERAWWALTRVRHGELIEPMLEALRDRDWRVQSYAAWTLGLARESRAGEQLALLLRHPVWRLRAMAASALGALEDAAARSAMADALTDPAWQVRVEAVRYFAALPIPSASRAELLAPRLADRHIAVRLAAERAFTP